MSWLFEHVLVQFVIQNFVISLALYFLGVVLVCKVHSGHRQRILMGVSTAWSTAYEAAHIQIWVVFVDKVISVYIFILSFWFGSKNEICFFCICFYRCFTRQKWILFGRLFELLRCIFSRTPNHVFMSRLLVSASGQRLIHFFLGRKKIWLGD